MSYKALFEFLEWAAAGAILVAGALTAFGYLEVAKVIIWAAIPGFVVNQARRLST